MQDADILEAFLQEAQEHVSTLEQDLLALSSLDAPDPETVKRLFRAVHSIKGGSAFFPELSQLTELTHAQENVFAQMRELKLTMSSDLIDILLRTTDHISTMVNESDFSAAGDLEGLIQTLNDAALGEDGGKAASESEASKASAGVPKTSSKQQASTLRVNVQTINRLMQVTGELVLVRNALMQTAGQCGNQAHHNHLKSLNAITSDLQNTVIQTRMQPLATVLNRFTRVAYDVANKLGKRVEIHIEGEDVELDRSVLELLGDPLVHLMRNAVDHGIETPAEREIAKKTRHGQIRINAFHHAGMVFIEMKDDGRGMDPDRLREKARQRGDFSEVELEAMSDRDIIQLVFSPGFSTAESVSQVSGRGVGMDVVRANLAMVGGSIEIDSTPGRGTKLLIKMPVSLAILPAMEVMAAGHYYYVPKAAIVSLISLTSDHPSHPRRSGQHWVMEHLGKLIPVTSLAEVLELRGPGAAVPPAGQESLIAVLSTGMSNYGLMVDAFGRPEEIVVKNPSDILKNLGCYTGTTIRSDGQVALILDVPGLAACVGMHFPQGTEGTEQHSDVAPGPDGLSDSFFVFKYGEGTSYAIPRSVAQSVIRVGDEEIKKVGGRDSIVYRGALVSLLHLHEHLEVPEPVAQERYFIFVYVIAGRPFGLVATDIQSIAKLTIADDENRTTQDGIFNTVIHDDEVISVVDLYPLTQRGFDHGTDLSTPELRFVQDDGYHALIVDDSAFCRLQYARLLDAWGITYTLLSSAREALDHLDHMPIAPDVCLIDLVMPGMDGFELIRKIRTEPRFAQLPLCAVSILANGPGRQEALDAGCDAVVVKLDVKQLGCTLNELHERRYAKS